jgi:hypothetical protein
MEIVLAPLAWLAGAMPRPADPLGADAHCLVVTEVTYVVCPASQAPSIWPVPAAAGWVSAVGCAPLAGTSQSWAASSG